MELPNDSTADLDQELDELVILQGLEILVERAEDGDEFARCELERIAGMAEAVMAKVQRVERSASGARPEAAGEIRPSISRRGSFQSGGIVDRR